MPAEPHAPGSVRRSPSPGALFTPVPLPRWRALVTVILAGTAALWAGGLLEYAAGSPAAPGTDAARYWRLFFALNTVAFGGAALLGGLPGMTRKTVKIAWVALVVGLYGAAFAVWYQHQPERGALAFGTWLARSPMYVPAALAVLTGLVFSDPSRRARHSVL